MRPAPRAAPDRTASGSERVGLTLSSVFVGARTRTLPLAVLWWPHPSTHRYSVGTPLGDGKTYTRPVKMTRRGGGKAARADLVVVAGSLPCRMGDAPADEREADAASGVERGQVGALP